MKKNAYTCKSVRDNSQRAEYKDGVIKVISRSGRQQAFTYSFLYKDLVSYTPTYNENYNLNEFIKHKVSSLALKGFDLLDPFYDRIIDAQCCAVKKVIDQISI